MTGDPLVYDLSKVLGPRSGENPFGFAPCRRGLLALDAHSVPLGFATDEAGRVSLVLESKEVVVCSPLTTGDLRLAYSDAVFVLGRCSASGLFEAT